MKLPDYATCDQCGEWHDACLRVVGGAVLCANCVSSDKRKPQSKCAICGELARCEKHHVAGRGAPMILRICLNCHAILSSLQYDWVGWPHERAPVRYLIQSVR